MKIFLGFLTILVLLIPALFLTSPAYHASAVSLVSPRPKPTVTTIKIDKSIFKDFKVDLEKDKVKLAQPPKAYFLSAKLDAAPQKIDLINNLIKENNFSPEFAQQVTENVKIINDLGNKPFLSVDETTQLESILDDFDVKASPCPQPAQEYEITVHVLNDNPEFEGKYVVKYVDAGKVIGAGTPANPGRSFAGNKTARAKDNVEIGNKYFWLQDPANSSLQGSLENFRITCTGAKDLYLPVPSQR